MGNRIKVGLQVRIHDIGVSLMKQSVHPSQGVLAAVAWAKPITVACKVPLEDRFQNITQCSLDDAVTNRGNAQRSFFFRSRFGNPNSFNGLGSVCSRPERLCQTAEVVLQSLLKHLDGLMIDPWTALVRLYQSKSAPKVRQRVDLIHQAVPLASSHPVFQGRQHAFRPDTRFNPGPSVTDLSDRFSPERHWSRLFLPSAWYSRIHLPASLCSTPITASHCYYGGSDSCMPLPGIQVSLFHVLNLPDHSIPNHLVFLRCRFSFRYLACQRIGSPTSVPCIVLVSDSGLRRSV